MSYMEDSNTTGPRDTFTHTCVTVLPAWVQIFDAHPRCHECDGHGQRELWPGGPKAGVDCETCGGMGRL